MSLLNNLYFLVGSGRTDAGTLATEYTVRFHASHPVFAGHFPGRPVVPGACLVQIAEELAALTLGRQIRFTSLRNLKFRQPLTPDLQITVVLRPDGVSTVNCNISDNSASFKAEYMCPCPDVQ